MRSRSVRRSAACLAATCALLGVVACGDDAAKGEESSAVADTDSSPVTADAAESTEASIETETASSESGTTDEPGDAPPVGGELTYLDNAEIESFDFFKTTGGRTYTAGGSLLYAVFGALVTDDPTTGLLDMGQAEAIETADDGLTWTFTLRPGMTFTDGTSFDADALLWNFQHYQDPASTGAGATTAASIATMTVVDPLTLEVVLKAPNVQFGRYIARNMPYVASPTALQELGDEFGEKPVGAGPFILEDWARDAQATLVRNPDYWDAPRPYVDKLTVRPVVDESQRLNTVSTGGADVALVQQGLTFAQSDDAGLQVSQMQLAGGYYFGFNFRVAPFDDVRVRLAVSMAINPEQLNEILHSGYGQAAHTLFPEGHTLYTDTALSLYDPDAAQALIDEYVAEKGGPVRFTGVGATSALHTAALEFLQSNLSTLDNVEMEIELLPLADLIGRVSDRKDFQLSVLAASGSDPEPTLFGNLYSTDALCKIGHNLTELDAALERSKTTDVDVRRDAYQEVSEIIAEQAPVYFFSRSPLGTISGTDVGGADKAVNEFRVRLDLLYVQ